MARPIAAAGTGTVVVIMVIPAESVKETEIEANIETETEARTVIGAIVIGTRVTMNVVLDAALKGNAIALPCEPGPLFVSSLALCCCCRM